MRVIIAGGRDFNNYDFLKEKVTKALQNFSDDDIIVVCGEAKGADSLGKQLAMEMGWEVHSFPADWETYGKRAGHIRNRAMAQNADALIAFWDGKSRGTKGMIEFATEAKLLTKVYQYVNN